MKRRGFFAKFAASMGALGATAAGSVPPEPEEEFVQPEPPEDVDAYHTMLLTQEHPVNLTISGAGPYRRSSRSFDFAQDGSLWIRDPKTGEAKKLL